MNYKDFYLGDWIGHISGVIEDESELDGNEMRDLVEFLTTLKQEPLTDVLDKIKADIEQYQADCDLSCSDNANCRTCNNITFGSIYRIIDKYKADMLK